MTELITAGSCPTSSANRFGLNYAREAELLPPAPCGIIDVHTHINGRRAAVIYRDVCQLFGVERVFSMSRFEEIDDLRDVLGDRIQFIAVPDYWSETNRRHNMGEGFAQRVREFHDRGVRIVKFWAAPRSIDFAREMGDPDMMRIDSPTRLAAMETAAELGMIFMTHIADPDTWFQTKYSDASVYGTKRDQYEPFERLLDRFTQPWIAAHMGGWPEDLDFLHQLLEDHSNLYLDTSAVKWQVRELSKHPAEQIEKLFREFPGRILFGSDIVTSDDHLKASEDSDHELVRKASSPDEAFDLYASRYWAMRALFETEYNGESPIADPDLAMVEPDRYTTMDAPPLRGKALPPELLRTIYRGAADALLGRFVSKPGTKAVADFRL